MQVINLPQDIFPERPKVKVIDIIRLKDGKYAEHWGSSNFFEMMREVAKR